MSEEIKIIEELILLYKEQIKHIENRNVTIKNLIKKGENCEELLELLYKNIQEIESLYNKLSAYNKELNQVLEKLNEDKNSTVLDFESKISLIENIRKSNDEDLIYGAKLAIKHLSTPNNNDEEFHNYFIDSLKLMLIEIKRRGVKL